MNGKKFGVGIGLFGMLMGLGLMSTGSNMCRRDCWMENMFTMFLPAEYEFLAGGLPWLLIGTAIVAATIGVCPRKDPGRAEPELTPREKRP